jgi:F0F1-type ATP synthase membrane subunit c/vacuolar-type H+-ATPase subunit K
MKNEGSEEVNGQVIWIVWAAMLMSMVVYGVVLMVIDIDPSQSPETSQMFAMVFGGVALVEIGVMFYLRKSTFFDRLNDGKFDDEQSLLSAYFTTSLLTWALAESIAIYGFVVSFLSGNILYFAGFAFFAAAAMLRFRPQHAALLEKTGLAEADNDDDSNDMSW